MQAESGGNATPTNIITPEAGAHGSSPKRGGSVSGTSDSGRGTPVRHVLQHGVSFVEEEKPLVPGIPVRAGSLHTLVVLAAHCFDEKEGEVITDKREFPRVLLLVHEWFITPKELVDEIIDLYRDCESKISCSVANCDHSPNSGQCTRQQLKRKLCLFVRFWIDEFAEHFHANEKLLMDFHRLVEEEGRLDLLNLVDTTSMPKYDWLRSISVRAPACKGRKVSLVFTNINPCELAEQLTYIEFKEFRRISVFDFKLYAQTTSLKNNPKLERSIALFNGLCQWIQCMVLSKTTPQERSDVIVKFANVAQRLRQLQNYNTLMAIVGGLTHSALARLNKTNSCIPPEIHKLLAEYTELLSSNNNFSNYRKALAQSTGFYIPILGVHLKDLILLHTALPDRVEGSTGASMINFRKMSQLSQTFNVLVQVHKSAVPVESNMDLIYTIRLSLDLHYTEDEIYELSLAREPRNSVSSPSTPTKPVVFADWVAGVSPPNTETINKHVHDMVDAVFKNYDHDKDGLISQAEFEAIAGNFPFIDSFCVLDADQDGSISKDEMETYFIRANRHAISGNALRSSFKHDFHEKTYFQPTFCSHCTGLLWGLIKQGWKCKDCGLNAHKHCKDLVVMECRKGIHSSNSTLQQSAQQLKSPTSTSSPVNLTLEAKRKMSMRQKRTTYTKGTQTNPADICPLSLDVQSIPFADDYSLQNDDDVNELTQENRSLKAKCECQQEEIHMLQNHIGNIRQHTISFILDQMDTLHMQRDSQV